MPGITDKDRGRLLYIPEIMERTGMPDGTIRSKYHTGTLPCVWKYGRRLVAWENDLDDWIKDRQQATTKVKDGSAPIGFQEQIDRLKEDLEAAGIPVRDALTASEQREATDRRESAKGGVA